ncbi:MAG TPA: VWA domain-containing protein [Pyrinomonadaceae bacterium]|nr:VWA domain-containing protein [Pyrinomonadaceae bacterium]
MKRTILAALAAVFFLAGFTGAFAQRTTTRTTRTTTTTTTTKTTTTTTKPIYATDNRDTLEMVFVLDTTGSMGGLIEGAKQRIWGIINEVMQKPTKPRVRVGLVAYRDNGDEYVTKLLPITEDLDKAYTTLMDYRAGGGGDTPENVRKALAEGVRGAGWSKSRRGLAQIVFLVGDAPPQNYAQEPDVLITTAEAVRKNMIVNTIQCGNLDGTREIWQTIALRGEGKYFAIAQDGGVHAISTPYDAKLAELAGKVGSTYVGYGEKAKRESNISARQVTELSIAGRAPATAQADRAVNKAVNTFQYDGDLLQDVENESVKLKDVKTDDLPEDLQKLSPAEREKTVAARIADRKKIRAEILELSKKRDAYIAEERKKAGQSNGFDTAVAAALKEQLLKKGIR